MVQRIDDRCSGAFDDAHGAAPSASSVQCSWLTHELGLAVGGLVLVDDALGRGLVDALDSGTQFVGSLSVLGARLDLRAHRLVAQAALLVLSVALDLALDVHVCAALRQPRLRR